MSKLRVLYICHNHPSVRPGGAEAYALELYEAMRDSDDFEPILVAKNGPPMSDARPHEGTRFSPVNGERDANQYFVFTDGASFDWFYGTSRGKELYTKYFREFLLGYQPDVVHFQHTLFLGYDLIREVRNTLPNTPIVYTLHEFLPICHHHGQMMRVGSGDRCTEASPRRCNECFPDISAADFFRRKRFIQSHFALVDVFIAPSRFLMERFIDWGIPRERIRFEDYGRLPARPAAEAVAERARTRVGYFGQFNPYKGVTVLLDAMRILDQEGCDLHCWLHGANLDLQTPAFQQLFAQKLEATRANVTLVGRYGREALAGLMANMDWIVVPSIWWENSPLVIQEAQLYGRPVICSDIGGMAEKVEDGVNGLHFRAGDPIHLAEVLRVARNSPGLWDRLRAGISEVYPMKQHLAVLRELYRGLLERRPARIPPPIVRIAP